MIIRIVLELERKIDNLKEKKKTLIV